MILGGSGVKTPAAGLSIRGNLNIKSGSTFNAGSFTHTVSGNWTNAGTFTGSTSTVVMNGAVNADGSSKTISTVSTSSVTNAFNNLTISNGSKKLLSNVYVKGILDLDNISTTENKLLTDAYRVDFSTTGSLARSETATQYIVGKVAADRTISNGSTGTSVAELFGNIGIRFTTSSTAPNVPITVVRITGENEQFEGKQSASRLFDITAGTLAEIPNLVVELSFLQHELVESIEKYAVYRKDIKGDWFLRESAPYTNDNATLSYRYSLSNVSELGRYTIAAPPTILPVELAWFKAQRQGQGVLLSWETASEKENKGFNVQVSTDGKRFSDLAFVESKVVNSAVKQRYSYTDNSTLASGTRYYRLAQVDLDGTTTYSNIKAVSLEAGPVAVKAYPNPFAEGQQVAVQLAPGTDRQVSLVLTNAMGQVVMQQQAQVEEGYFNLAVDVTAAKATGMYFLSVVDGGSKHTFRLIKR
ncbi:hypothetical protein GCM10023188_17030 [Pontibacter saemangeumensis]|uniref:Por secretion system C-terminal sorting domain-containing protein n=1 Tax=Pontibacter saemangeumensis TaxID=1084525 RepID=A0ABP8LJU1_9BACT